MQWKEQLFKEWDENSPITKFAVEFIETQIIEKMIEDIPDGELLSTGEGNTNFYENSWLKQQLRAKWLNN